MFKNLKENKAFTLLEVLIAVFVLGTGIAAVFGSIAQTISAATFAKDKLIAAYLAQEGIEIVKNIRDSNWVRREVEGDVSWNEGLAPGDYQADYNDTTLSSYNSFDRLMLDSSGYHYRPPGPGVVRTKFQRRIQIQTISPNELRIIVEIFREGRSFFEARSIITNWL